MENVPAGNHYLSTFDPIFLKPMILIFILLLIVQSTGVAQSNSDCIMCHSDNSLTMSRSGKSVSLFVNEKTFGKSVHGGLTCVTCHEGFKAEDLPHKSKISKVECFGCHNDIGNKHSFHPQLGKSLAEGKRPNVNCVDCHGKHDILSSKSSNSKFNENNSAESCTECHSDVKDIFLTSSHGKALEAQQKGAPNCLTCHRHEVSNLSGIRDSLQFKKEQEKMCLSCHLDNPDVQEKASPSAGFIAAYEKSVHGKALLRGNSKAANCVDCHGSHEMKKSLDPSAKISKLHISETCSQCHGKITEEYSQSIHGTALRDGILESPTCTDCHGEHNILDHNDPNSRVANTNVSEKVCSPCHSSLKLSEKYGLMGNRTETYRDSYHGLAVKAGSIEVANCASCHGIHNIKPSTDSTSMISKANMVKTCGKCHPGANERFTIGSVHSTTADIQEPLLYWIANTYILMIILTIGGMLIHNILDFIRKSKRKLMIRRGLIPEPHHGTTMYLRMSANERVQHATLVVSFITLVLTGFALKFPDAWWVAPLRNISPVMFDIRGIVHRIAGVIMIVASFYHIYYILFVERGKKLVRDLLPRQRDLTDVMGLIRYNVGISDIKPRFERFSYIEKAEYWALVWGTIVMGVTGFVLWFDNTFMGLLTKLGWDAARTVHYYEAWLATLAIIVWHFYFVIFNPDVYPLNLAFWKGTLTEEEMEDEHPVELEELKKAELLEEIKSDQQKIQSQEETIKF
ncbi:MAG: cytochrome b/b6 domain-containing protein [Ignavibacteriales bacterium]|nr:cytochrome b/b6 domain-containing protein [Ignavibacteriales bacterium]